MMYWPDTLILFGFGLILGSFLNALAFRYQSGRSMWGRSACMTCNKELQAQDLVPVLSYLVLRGKCRMCRAKVSVQYPVVEIIAGVLTVLSYCMSPEPLQFTLTLAFFSTLLFICIYDIRHTIIPDAFVYAASITALALFFVRADFDLLQLDPYTMIAGPLLALPIAAIWFYSKGKAMGLGDAKLFLAVGWFLGFFQGVAAFILSFWIGAIVGVFLLLMSPTRGGGYKMKSEIPFGPFIAFACALTYFASIDVYTLFGFLSL